MTLKFHQSGVCAFLQIGSSMGLSRHLALQRLAGRVIIQSQKQADVSIMIMAKFRPEEGIFCMIDDGECIALNEDSHIPLLKKCLIGLN